MAPPPILPCETSTSSQFSQSMAPTPSQPCYLEVKVSPIAPEHDLGTVINYFQPFGRITSAQIVPVINSGGTVTRFGLVEIERPDVAVLKLQGACISLDESDTNLSWVN